MGGALVAPPVVALADVLAAEGEVVLIGLGMPKYWQMSGALSWATKSLARGRSN